MDNRHLIAAEGMVLTNGEVYVVELWLGDGDNPDNWREVPQEEAVSVYEEEVEGKEVESYE